MSRLIPLVAGVLMPVLLAGCANLGHADQTPLHDVRYYSVDIFATTDRDLRISPDGEVVVAERTGNTAKDVRQVTGQLTPEQRAALAAAFDGWKSLKPYYASDINAVVWIEYEGYRVTTSSILRTPENFNRVKTMLDKIAERTLASDLHPTTQPDATRPNVP